MLHVARNGPSSAPPAKAMVISWLVKPFSSATSPLRGILRALTIALDSFNRKSAENGRDIGFEVRKFGCAHDDARYAELGGDVA